MTTTRVLEHSAVWCCSRRLRERSTESPWIRLGPSHREAVTFLIFGDWLVSQSRHRQTAPCSELEHRLTSKRTRKFRTRRSFEWIFIAEMSCSDQMIRLHSVR